MIEQGYMAKKWKPAAQGTKKRKAMPKSAFLVTEQRKYPYKVKRGDKWVISEQGLMSAYKRASQQHDAPVRAKALTKLNKIRRAKGKKAVGKK
jgi:hypothetical protein